MDYLYQTSQSYIFIGNADDHTSLSGDMVGGPSDINYGMLLIGFDVEKEKDTMTLTDRHPCTKVNGDLLENRTCVLQLGDTVEFPIHSNGDGTYQYSKFVVANLAQTQNYGEEVVFPARLIHIPDQMNIIPYETWQFLPEQERNLLDYKYVMHHEYDSNTLEGIREAKATIETIKKRIAAPNSSQSADQGISTQKALELAERNLENLESREKAANVFQLVFENQS